MVNPQALPEFEKQLSRANATAEIFIANVQE